jgi:hypothetical protein
MYTFAKLLAIVTISAAGALPSTPSASLRAIQAPDLSGTYVLDASRSDDPAQAAKSATGSMGRFKRRIVQKRSGGEMKPADTVSIAMHGDTVILNTSGRLHLTTVPDADAKSRSGQKGGSAQLASTWEGDTLVVKTSSEKFQREARYSRDQDGTSIRIAITMSGGNSGNPLHYSLVYRRAVAAT